MSEKGKESDGGKPKETTTIDLTHALGLHINTGSGNDLLNVGNDGADDG